MEGMRLDKLTCEARRLKEIRKADLNPGDRIVIKTANSIYSVQMVSGQQCVVSGGWFDKKGISPARTHVAGCTWGGTAIKIDTIAACGLCVEFANRVRTSRVRAIFVFRRGSDN